MTLFRKKKIMNHSGRKNNSLQLRCSLTVFFQGRAGSTAGDGWTRWRPVSSSRRSNQGEDGVWTPEPGTARFDVPACPRDAAATGLRTVDTGARAACFDGPRPAVSSRCCGHWVEDGGRQS
jgi:hypothetical protein